MIARAFIPLALPYLKVDRAIAVSAIDVDLGLILVKRSHSLRKVFGCGKDKIRWPPQKSGVPQCPGPRSMRLVGDDQIHSALAQETPHLLDNRSSLIRRGQAVHDGANSQVAENGILLHRRIQDKCPAGGLPIAQNS